MFLIIIFFNFALEYALECQSGTMCRPPRLAPRFITRTVLARYILTVAYTARFCLDLLPTPACNGVVHAWVGQIVTFFVYRPLAALWAP
jgi:hypothetical protein